MPGYSSSISLVRQTYAYCSHLLFTTERILKRHKVQFNPKRTYLSLEMRVTPGEIRWVELEA